MLWYFINRMAGIAFGGGETYQLEIAKALRDQGEEVLFIAGRRRYFKPLDLPGFSPRYVTSPYLRRWAQFSLIGYRSLILDTWLFRRAAYRCLRRLAPPDVVLINDALLEVKKLRRIFPQAVLAAFIPGSCLPVWRDNMRQFDFVVTDGAFFPQLKELYPRRSYAIAGGVDVRRFRPRGENLRQRLGLAPEHIVILHVGRHIPIKNLPLLLRAFTLASQERADLRLVCVGTGPHHAEAVALAQNLGIASQVTFTGSVPDADLPLYYNSADIFALTSKNESYPLGILEAMASKLPVVATRVGGILQQVEQDRGGFLVEPGDAAELARAILVLAHDGDLRRQMGEFNRQVVLSRNSWEAAARRYQELVQALRRGQPLPPHI